MFAWDLGYLQFIFVIFYSSLQHGRAELLAGFKSDDANSIMAAGRLHMTYNMTRYSRWLETQRAQAQFPVTFISVQLVR